MSDKNQSTKQEPPPTIITLTLPTPSEGGIPLERATATLLIKRGDLAHIRQFTYIVMEDMTTAIKEAYLALAAVEAEPPVIPEAPKTAPKSEPKAKSKAEPKPIVEEEPTIDIPLKKGTLAVKISHLKIIGGETDAAAYRQAVLIAGKLIDGKLWDGTSPIRIDDVYVTLKKMKHLSEREMSLFTLEDFVQIGGTTDAPEAVTDVERDAVEVEDDGIDTEPLLMAMPSLNGKTFSANGHHPDDADDE
ncbi:MAG: hypothetical protein LCI00_12960 [Chloroflexi bacterium]|nr:hypothetical protein [Chloroflexota bacterium]